MRKNIFLGIAVIVAIGFVACNKDEKNNQLLLQKSMTNEFVEKPFTYLQNKYLDVVLTYELNKQGTEYNPESFSYEKKLETILFLDSTMDYEETENDVNFHTNLQKELMDEINSHPYVQKFIQGFALDEDYDVNDMAIHIGYGCHDAISKFQILKYYEDGIDLIAHYETLQNLTGDNEYCLFPTKNPTQKTVRYTGFSKWGKKIEYMFNGASSNTRAGVRSAMTEWSAAANYKISFSEITKKANWNKTCWIMGWKYFLRINSSKSKNSSTLGKVPWADMYFTAGANIRTFRHELGHALGLLHEHQRADRDNYITYYPKNVQSGKGPQFMRITGLYNYYGSAFDFNSIMLYDSYSFAKIQSPKDSVNATMLKKDGSEFSKPTTISATDKNVISQIYN